MQGLPRTSFRLHGLPACAPPLRKVQHPRYLRNRRGLGAGKHFANAVRSEGSSRNDSALGRCQSLTQVCLQKQTTKPRQVLPQEQREGPPPPTTPPTNPTRQPLPPPDYIVLQRPPAKDAPIAPHQRSMTSAGRRFPSKPTDRPTDR